MRKTTKLEAVLWSVALPGFGQLLNGQLIKGLTFIFLEFLINTKSSFNNAILYSFLGQINKAIEVVNYQWLMFYPCVYMFAMYDAYKYSTKNTPYLSFLPFVGGAYTVTVGLMYSSKLHFGEVLLGPIWLPIIFLVPGLILGFIVRYLLIKCLKGINEYS
ncbi:hypothetical protein ACFW1J_16540 [Priestia aryabhattai]|uniref:hypothetical protein n=1 Tax=Priestia aryabhattai TaxID=412384 RepID=UPI001C8F0C28|nr:hypothetical protein [Priestia aryabhattai]MBX9969645.1 hypothetical protein [Priestia aryabhattai]